MFTWTDRIDFDSRVSESFGQFTDEHDVCCFGVLVGLNAVERAVGEEKEILKIDWLQICNGNPPELTSLGLLIPEELQVPLYVSQRKAVGLDSLINQSIKFSFIQKRTTRLTQAQIRFAMTVW